MATKKRSQASDSELAEAVPADFVYAGRATISSGRLGDVIVWVEINGTLAAELTYNAGAKKRVIGGVYRGAKRAPGSVIGLNTARWTGDNYRGPDHANLIMGWQARDSAEMAAARLIALEADKAKASVIEDTMRPLRALYTNYSDRGDWSGMRALESAVQNALRRRYGRRSDGKFNN